MVPCEVRVPVIYERFTRTAFRKDMYNNWGIGGILGDTNTSEMGNTINFRQTGSGSINLSQTHKKGTSKPKTVVLHSTS
jgi:hypothetical protein